jgi:hypothetical protein
MALGFYLAEGIRGDRIRQNSHGYLGLLRDLDACPAWITVEPEDVGEDVLPMRAPELRPLIEFAAEHDDDELLSAFRSNMLAPPTGFEALSDVLSKAHEESLLERVHLGRILGTKVFYDICNAVFDCDEFTPASGAPDLLLWSPPGVSPFWFFLRSESSGRLSQVKSNCLVVRAL